MERPSEVPSTGTSMEEVFGLDEELLYPSSDLLSSFNLETVTDIDFRSYFGFFIPETPPFS